MVLNSFVSHDGYIRSLRQICYLCVDMSDMPNEKNYTLPADVRPNAIAVDAACSGNPGRMEYRGVFVANGQEMFHVGPFDDSTNNIGEFLALVHALALIWRESQHRGREGEQWKRLTIYSDSKTAMTWVKNKKVKTTLKRTQRNDASFQLLQRALRWLESHDYTTPILKWETDKWGEVPADFGRKKH